MIKKDELLFVVDENNSPVEPKPRDEVHKNAYWHRVAYIWIVNDKKEMLCQQRTMLKDEFPGMWEWYFGGHMAPGADYLDSASRELEEELGIDVPKEELIFEGVHKHLPNTQYDAVFILKWNGDSSTLKLEEDEVELVKWIALDDIRKLFNEKDEHWVLKTYTNETLDWIEKNCYGTTN